MDCAGIYQVAIHGNLGPGFGSFHDVSGDQFLQDT